MLYTIDKYSIKCILYALYIRIINKYKYIYIYISIYIYIYIFIYIYIHILDVKVGAKASTFTRSLGSQIPAPSSQIADPSSQIPETRKTARNSQNCKNAQKSKKNPSLRTHLAGYRQIFLMKATRTSGAKTVPRTVRQDSQEFASAPNSR